MLRSSPEPLKFYDNTGTVFVASNSIDTIVKSVLSSPVPIRRLKK